MTQGLWASSRLRIVQFIHGEISGRDFVGEKYCFSPEVLRYIPRNAIQLYHQPSVCNIEMVAETQKTFDAYLRADAFHSSYSPK